MLFSLWSTILFSVVHYHLFKVIYIKYPRIQTHACKNIVLAARLTQREGALYYCNLSSNGWKRNQHTDLGSLFVVQDDYYFTGISHHKGRHDSPIYRCILNLHRILFIVCLLTYQRKHYFCIDSYFKSVDIFKK